jgi:hypothetical protein
VTGPTVIHFRGNEVIRSGIKNPHPLRNNTEGTVSIYSFSRSGTIRSGIKSPLKKHRRYNLLFLYYSARGVYEPRENECNTVQSRFRSYLDDRDCLIDYSEYYLSDLLASTTSALKL